LHWELLFPTQGISNSLFQLALIVSLLDERFFMLILFFFLFFYATALIGKMMEMPFLGTMGWSSQSLIFLCKSMDKCKYLLIEHQIGYDVRAQLIFLINYFSS
jgi:hypothetical protein